MNYFNKSYKVESAKKSRIRGNDGYGIYASLIKFAMIITNLIIVLFAP